MENPAMSNLIVYLWVAMFFTLSANAGEVCGRIVKGSSHAQMVPPQGKTQGKIEEDDQVACGSMIITNQEPVWIELADLTRFKLAPDTFFETSPELMDSSSIKPAFSVFAATEEETVELTAVVERAVAERSKTFVSDLETWEGIAEQKEKQNDVQRSIASDSKNGKHSSIDDPEAMVALELLKRHLYGEENDWKTHDDSRRVPSSVMAKEILKDSVYDRKKAEVKKKVKKVLKEIDTFDTEQEE